VSGCGPIGTLAVAAAVVHGAAEVIAVDMTDEPLQIARSMGAHVLVNGSTDEHWCSRYNVNKGTVDVVMECSGSASALRAALDVIRPRGVIVQLGLGGDVSVPQNTIVAKEICICGSFRFHAEFPLAVRLINEGRVDLSPMITRAFPLERARDAFDLAGNRRRAMKVLLDFNSAGN
jgi:L-idonate 5-dehydrogenase